MINENIRFFKPNDPYYYEVDNMPIDGLIENCVSLQNEIDAIPSAEVFVTGDWLNNFLLKTTYESRTIGNITDVATNPQPGFCLVFEGGVWTPKLLKDTLSTSFDNVNIDNPSTGQLLKKVSGQWQADDVLVGATMLSEFTDIEHTAANSWESFGKGWPNPPITCQGLRPDGSPESTGWSDGWGTTQFHAAHSDGNWPETMFETAGYEPSKDNPYITDGYIDSIFGAGAGNARAATMQDIADLAIIVSSMVDLDWGSENELNWWTSPFHMDNPRGKYMDLSPGDMWSGDGSYMAPNGFHIQWSTGTHDANYDYTFRLNWPKSFRNKCLGVHVCGTPGITGTTTSYHQNYLSAQLQSFDIHGATVRLQQHNDWRSGQLESIRGIAFGY
tara:strand:+ start:3025 stop:4185 length:1161 start_codon:yes stop_codon:yes gene_type:complete